MILVRTTRHGATLGLSPEECEEYFQRWMKLRQGSDANEWAATDKVLLEMGQRILKDEGADSAGAGLSLP